MSTAAVLKLGLRFARKDARRLEHLAYRAQLKELGNDAVGLFRNAADAARTGEPLIIQCQEKMEVEMMADGFVLYGLTRPLIDELSPDGRAR